MIYLDDELRQLKLQDESRHVMVMQTYMEMINKKQSFINKSGMKFQCPQKLEYLNCNHISFIKICFIRFNVNRIYKMLLWSILETCSNDFYLILHHIKFKLMTASSIFSAPDFSVPVTWI